jgi:hypothetical protein
MSLKLVITILRQERKSVNRLKGIVNLFAALGVLLLVLSLFITVILGVVP